jgi:hypothetical protein
VVYRNVRRRRRTRSVRTEMLELLQQQRAETTENQTVYALKSETDHRHLRKHQGCTPRISGKGQGGRIFLQNPATNALTIYENLRES